MVPWDEDLIKISTRGLKLIERLIIPNLNCQLFLQIQKQIVFIIESPCFKFSVVIFPYAN